jgi:hypothetical protein
MITNTLFDKAFVARATPAFVGPDPTSVSNLRVWYAAWKENSYSDGDPVGTFHDWSGNGYNATAVTTSRPTFKTAQINGKPALLFDGTAFWLTLPDFFTGMAGAEAFLVLKGDSTQGSGSLVGLWAMPRTDDNENYPWTDQNVYDGFFSTTRKSCGNSGLAANWYKSWHTYNVVSIAGEYTARVNNTQFFTTASNTAGGASGTNSGNGYRLGRSSSGSGFWFKGWIAELIVYSAKLGSTDRSTIYTYLNGRYGI